MKFVRRHIDKWLMAFGLLLILVASIQVLIVDRLSYGTIAALGSAAFCIGCLTAYAKRFRQHGQPIGALNQTLPGRDLKLARKQLIPTRKLHGKLDSLTKLPDREALAQTLEQAIAARPASDKKILLIAFDIDRLKDINGCYGFEIGDAILQETANRLNNVGADLVVRMTGDRFAVLFTDIESRDRADMIGATCLDRIAQPITSYGSAEFDISPSASAGIAIFPDHGSDFAELYKRAELAVDCAKRAGGRRCRLFETDMIDTLKRRRAIEHDLKRAIDQGELHLVFQPQIDLRTGLIFGAEALMRWQDPNRGAIPPGVFIPVAESTGLIRPMGAWLIEEACRCARQWRLDGLDLVVAINISTAQLRQHDLIESIADTLSQHRLNPGDIELELTESLFVDPAELMMRRMLDDLARMGVNLAIDDFGTGFSSLAYLKHLPVSKIKIDKSFISGIGQGSVDEALIRTIIDLGRTFDKTVLAEGVENEMQQHFLTNEGCHQAQGYYFARPLSFEACGAMAKRQRFDDRQTTDLHRKSRRRAG